MSKEQLITHGQVKTRSAFGLSGRIADQGLGYYWADGPLVSNDAADLAVNPDGVFVARDDIRTKQVVLREGWEEGHVEIQGAPSLVLEVVSRKSVQKDTVTLRNRYWRADIPEYFLVDARKTPLAFDILRATSRGYVATRKQDGWVRSQVFDGLFRLTQTSDQLGNPLSTLESR